MEEQTKIMFSVEKCKTKAAYSAKLVKKGKLDLNKIKKKFEIKLETPILLVVLINGIEIIIHKHGELLFKKCDDVTLMWKLAQEIYEVSL